MSITDRFDPADFDSLQDILLAHEMLRLNCKRLLNIVKRTAKSSCCLCRDSCLSCDAAQLLNELGEEYGKGTGDKTGNNADDISSTDTFKSADTVDTRDL